MLLLAPRGLLDQIKKGAGLPPGPITAQGLMSDGKQASLMDPSIRYGVDRKEQPSLELPETHDLDKLLRTNEGEVPYIYKDTKSNPTYGTGIRMYGMERHRDWRRADSFFSNQQLNKMGLSPSSSVAFKNEAPVQAPNNYKQDYIKERNKWIDHSIKQFPEFLSYPKDIQLAINDMHFNMGDLIKRKKPFKRFVKAVINKEWGDAGAEIKDSDYYRYDAPKRAEENRQRFLKYEIKDSPGK